MKNQRELIQGPNIYIYGGALCLMVISIGNEHGDLSSNPRQGCLHIALIPLGKEWIQLLHFTSS